MGPLDLRTLLSRVGRLVVSAGGVNLAYSSPLVRSLSRRTSEDDIYCGWRSDDLNVTGRRNVWSLISCTIFSGQHGKVEAPLCVVANAVMGLTWIV